MGYSVLKASDEQGKMWFLWSSSWDRPATGVFTKRGMLAYLLWREKSDSWNRWLDDGRLTRTEVNTTLMGIFNRMSNARDADEGGFINVNRYGEDEEELSKDAFLAKLRATENRFSFSEDEIIYPWAKWLALQRCFGSREFEAWMQSLLEMMGKREP